METPAAESQQNGKQDGRSDSGRGPRLREIPFRLLVPNLITVLAICAGLSGVRLAIEGRFELAVGMVLLAAFLDGVDGRVARMMKATSKFGEQMDSLADIVNFGVAPALVVYIYLLDQARSIGWIGALIYVIAAGLRLARFNVMIERPVKAPWQSEFFVGVPAPMGAMLVLLPVYLGFLGVEPDKPFAYVAAAYTVLIGYLLISRLPVWSGKSSTRIRRDLVLPMILVVVLYVAMLMSFTWEVLVLTVAAYLVFIPISARLWHRRYGTLTIEEDAHDDANGGNGLDRGI
ncbi:MULTISPECIES: CDP-diacylglycerol--serine O-phosphatidyltransferase [unclassified Agrobacterium]|uniref:CDP-diacylglycerol--serine O-phosphatidyltransferase n=1 Tax=unclassified Agrobacterium TaxID=2632611 RepID=UPI0002E015B2|nr:MULTISPECIES: CDP-diacylglycerol--serine O-phosphatidyltransferase [unclassified Agrobacterium]QKW96329.1 CDP-diacylglycerol--serine O-phosphatidyltransferase [Agrobacterium sp. CGMCC 11546]